MSARPHVEVAAIINDGAGNILVARRKGRKTGNGQYELPGGNLKFGEEIAACARREVLEETGLDVRGDKVVAFTNDIQSDAQKHEVTLYVLVEPVDKTQTPEHKQPEKFDSWEWKAWKEISSLGEAELWLQTLNLVRSGQVNL